MSSGGGNPPDIPSINITTDFATPPERSANSRTQASGLLSPNSPGSASESGSVPPSPTLSAHSANFPTSLQLRQNKPEGKDGLSSLGLLEPGSAHARTPSTDTSMTDVDSGKPDSKDTKKKKKSKDAKDEEDAETAHQRELAQDAAIDPRPFAFKPFQLAHLLDPKNFAGLKALGGINGIVQGLGVDLDRGLSSEAHTPHNDSHPPPAAETTETAKMADRRRVFGDNILPTRPSKTLLQLMAAAMKDKVLILLSVAAVISLALGFVQDFAATGHKDPTKPEEPPVDWVEGVAIVIAILIVVLVGSLNDWQKERQFRALNERKEERGVKVIRDGVEKVIDIKEVVVGDIALLEPGEIVPCDGIFISGHNVKCDESGATGESDAIKKLPYNELLALEGTKEGSAHTDCFVISGSKVLEGVGKYVVVAVGTKSFNGRIMMALRGDTENTPLQFKLNHLAGLIAKVGSVAGLALFTALMIRFFVQLGRGVPVRSPSENGFTFVNILIIAVTLVVVAVPEGLPLAVTLALAFATKRMTGENLLVRVLGSCETMANASVICTDKTGTLTQNAMTVVAGSLGIHAKFVRQLGQNAARTNANEVERTSTGAATTVRKHQEDFSIEQGQLNTIVSDELRDLFNEAITVNSTAFADVDAEGKEIFVGSKTETALLEFAQSLQWPNFRQTRESAEIIQMIPFSSARKAMGVVVRKGTGYRVYFKGASEILAKKSTHHVVVSQHKKTNGVETKLIDDLARENITNTIIFYANQMLRTIALCYRDLPSWPPANINLDDQGEVPFEELSRDLTLIAITGIEDPLRDGVIDAVQKCHRAGVTVKMCTGDNVLTARSIATQCGIFTPGGMIMEGPVFRQLSQPEMIEIVPRLQVLARSSPEDKKILVETLKKIGEIVAVTGDGTNDGPALKTANVGFSMGIAGTEVAKEASDIILMDDNFASIVKAIMWGRCVNDAVRKFLQFQLSTNVTAVIITFISAVSSEQEESVLTAVQLLWINIIMDTFAALALATDPATEALLDRKPDKKTAPLFSVDMYKMILMQSVYQIIIILLFHFRGIDFLGLEHTEQNEKVIKTLVFNAFVFAQIFNSLNCRRLDNKLNVFEGIFRNRYFIVITMIEIVIQVLIVFVGGAAFQVVRMGGREWGISLALGFVSLPWGAIIRCMPNGPFTAFFRLVRLLPRKESDLPTTQEPEDGWHGAISVVRDNLNLYSNIRGGRLRSSSLVLKSRNAFIKSEDEPMRLSSVLAMAPTIIMGAVGAATYYVTGKGGSLSDPGNADPSRSSAALWEGKVQIHPDTPHDDPIYRKYGMPDSAAPKDPKDMA